MTAVARTLAALSLGLVGFTFAGCGPQGSAMARKGRLRAVEPRLADGAAYATCRSDATAADLIPDTVCGPARRPPKKKPDAKAPDQPAIRGPKASAGAEAEETGIALGDLLSQGGIQEPDRIVRRLEKAVGANPRDARTWNDLAAACLVRAQRADNPLDLLRAYEAAHRAVEEDGSLPEARFNRALILERLFLIPEAAAAWRDYLHLDATSEWAGEARQRLEKLGRTSPRSAWESRREQLERAALADDAKEVETIVDSYRLAAREYAEQELFGAWADAAAEGRAKLAADRLRILRAVGDALVKVNGERLVHDSVAAVDAAAGDPGRWRELARGTRDFRDGYKDFNDRTTKAAVPRLTAARAALTRAGSPLALRAEHLLIGCDYLDSQFGRALASAGKLARDLEGKPYAGVRGQVLWIKALSEVTLGKMKPAVEDYGRMRAEYQRLGEEENLVAVQGLLGESLMLIGRTQEAWRSIYQALRVTPRLRQPRALSRIFMIAGDAALREGADGGALAFEQERVRYGLLTTPREAVEALTWLARMQDHMGDRESALATLGDAERRTALLEPEQRRRNEADLAMVQGTMRVRDDPARAVALLTTALGVYEKDGNFIFSLQALLARGRAYRNSGDDLQAERDLEAALALYDRMGEQLDQEDLRLALLEEADEAFDEMISLQAGRDPDRAFAYADRARTRVLPGSAATLSTGTPAELDRLLAAEPQPLPLAEILGRVPREVALAQFSVLEDRVLIWLLRRDGRGVRFFERPIRKENLEAEVARLQQFGRPGWDTTAAGLFDLLVRPWLDAVPPGERIVLIPDKALHRVPFAALKDRSTGRFLIEGHPLAVAPSATLYVNALSRGGGTRRTFHFPGLVVGEPAIDRIRFQTLSSLPEAAAEARRLASLTGSLPLLGKDASKSAFLDRARQAEWIHFSGHAIVDPQNTLLSQLVLAPGPDGDAGILTAREIYALRLEDTRLVVLAACETGNQYVPGSEGVTSLARAFLAAGVPTVTASLWSVDDRPTAVLFDAFHRHLWNGEDPVDALRAAQLEMLLGDDPADRSPKAWAGFEVIGASARR